ncbi:Winged helix-turn-helix transcription repressor DNA-binding [Penicillium concentricum]|uniref:Winged helix-turn-helix transcription repressor DNA-binding n=1 Tax=Penicillium concentricum TaxID=293559 RepID=A0A9W9SVT0_9EURO|nr:Winged helix-turn-helix transcription repressor DNA-binding [Penicillium concentricum]KAJ5385475.1 Winged helix-turn-helix transcription repressor DNA-binding [Penicillium concentricum]
MAADNAKYTSCPVDLRISTRPNNAEAVPGLLKEVIEGVNSLPTGTDEDRKNVLIKCRALVGALETPREIMVDHCWGQFGAISAIGFGVDSGLWVLMARNGDQPQKVTDLAASLGVDPRLLSRLMRHIGAMGLLIEVGDDEYRPTNFTKALSLPQIGHGYLGFTACTGAGTLKFHEFARKRNWVNPTDNQDTSLMYAYGTDKDIFSFVNDLGYGKHLNDYFGGYNLGRPWWMDPGVYPVKERLIDGADPSPDAPFLVDIGGNVGHDLERFRSRFPNTPGKLIVQDLPLMIRQIKDLDPAIVRMEYDFHDEQPVKGARAYYIHSTLHNWSDDVCEIVLKRVKEAMKPGYSRLLINENVVPDIGAHWETTGLDMMMLTLFSGEERTSTAWYDLIERRAGLRIVKIWGAGKGVESVIECVNER